MLLCGALLLIATGGKIATAQDARNVISRVQETIKGHHDIAVTFRQTFEWRLTGNVQQLDGKIYLRDLDKFRIETEEQVIVSDGKSLWTYSVPANQVVIDRVRRSHETRLPRDFLFHYPDDYKPRLVKDEAPFDETYLVELLPTKKGAFITKIRVWVDGGDWTVQRIEHKDLNGNVTTYEILDIELEPDFKNVLFSFQPAEEAHVIDLR